MGASSTREAGHPVLVLWDNPEGWGVERGRSGIHDWGGSHMCIPVANSC